MTWVNFHAYPATVQTKFTCTVCGKQNRRKSITERCTLNPFNTEATTAAAVQMQSEKRARDLMQQFLREPVCRSCEDRLDGAQLRRLLSRRKGLSTGTCIVAREDAE